MAEARKAVESARALISGLNQPYNLSRAIFYQASLEYSDGRLHDALGLFEEAAAKSHAVGNQLTEGTALMNLGVINFYLGRPTAAMDFYRRSREVFVGLRDERRVAEMDVNAAGLQIDYSTGREDALKTLANAKANLEKLGHVDFQLVALQTEAEADRYVGRINDSRTVLRSALQIAREHQLTAKTTVLRTALAQTDLEANDYEAARAALDDLVNQDPSNDVARIALGVVLTRLGDVEAAEAHLEQALDDVQKRELVGLLPSVHTALGQLAYQMKRTPAALEHFDLAMSSWSDPLPDPSSVEARCSSAMLRALQGQSGAIVDLNASVESAAKVQRLSLDIHCRLELARAEVSRRSYAQALAVLKKIPEGKPPITIGPETRAQIDYWTRLATAAGNETEGRSAINDVRGRMETFRSTLPDKFRDLFAARQDISEILLPSGVRSHQ
jgi:tetratricopeptide (TPR) repeat protein